MADENNSEENKNITTETIKFTENNEIVRNIPDCLDGKMKLEYWNKFCDDCDEAMKPIGRVTLVKSLLAFACFVFGILAASGFKFGDIELSAYYGVVAPVTIILIYFWCQVEAYAHKKAASKIHRACSEVGNYIKGLTLTLEDEEVDWYIKITINNALQQQVEADVEAAVPAMAVAAAVSATQSVSAVPVAISSVSSSNKAPEKYVKDEETGKMKLNPEYRKWMNANK